MIKPDDLHKMLQAKEFVPQAVLAVDVSHFSNWSNSKLVSDHDDFDEFTGSAFWLDNFMPFTVMHYKGHPPNTSTIYLPFDIKDLDQITDIVYRIASEFKVVDKILWQRKDKPNL